MDGTPHLHWRRPHLLCPRNDPGHIHQKASFREKEVPVSLTLTICALASLLRVLLCTPLHLAWHERASLTADTHGTNYATTARHVRRVGGNGREEVISKLHVFLMCRMWMKERLEKLRQLPLFPIVSAPTVPAPSYSGNHSVGCGGRYSSCGCGGGAGGSS